MASPTVDIGVEVVNGWPVHKRQCDECNGAARILVEVGPPHQPADYYVPCEARGCVDGFIKDEDCDCPVCVTLAEAYQDQQDLNREENNRG